MPSDIILIGPIGVGKSTQGKLLAKRLGLPQHAMDDLRWDYYDEIGYDHALAQQKRTTEGMKSVIQYWKPFEAYAVERLLSDHQNCVIDFGAGHSVYSDKLLFERVQQALAPYPNVVLLLPAPDIHESLQILSQRNRDLPSDTHAINERYLRHPSNSILARHTVYTKSKSPEETCAGILQITASV
ncbi:MAG: AAA family ATPase [Cyanobacteria bacterium J06632_22]